MNTVEEEALKFETYRNYLHRFCLLSRSLHLMWPSFAKAVAVSTQSLQPLNGLDTNWIERFMGIAWATECLLRHAPEDAHLLRIQNAWLPVQAYYAVYAAAEAVVYALDGSKAESHNKALRKATDFLVKGPIAPWNLSYCGAKGRDGKQHKPKNFPNGVRPEHNLAGKSASDIGVIATCLKAEHQKRIQEDYKRSRAHQYAYDPGDTSLLHFLYRLRIRANYRGIDLFLVTSNDEDAQSFRNSLLFLVERTLTYFEIILLRKCKRDLLTRITENFLAKSSLADAMRKRFQVYQTLY